MLLQITLSLSNFSRVDLLPGGSIVDLEYADDMVLFGEDVDKAHSLLTTLINNASMFGMRLSLSPNVKCNFKIGLRHRPNYC